MARLEDLINDIAEPALRNQIAGEVGKLKARKKFGLVFEQLMLANGVSKSAMVDSIIGSIYRNPQPSSGVKGLDPVSKRFETEFDRKAYNTKGKPLQQK